MTGHDDTCGSLQALAVHLRRLGLRARLDSGPCPALEVSNPLLPRCRRRSVSRAGRYVAFDGMVLGPAGEPRAAASRLGYLLGLIRT